MTKKRVDTLMVEQGLVNTLDKATALILARKVRVNQQVIYFAGMRVDEKVAISIKTEKKFVSRGGYKLEAGLSHFGVFPKDKICADVGACTGGFTDVLLQNGAKRVYAIDVGYGDLAWKLRQDPRIVVMERTNVRKVSALPEKISLVVVDVSFISLKLVLPVLRKWLTTHGDVITLVKPQFEAEKKYVGKGGVIRDSQVHKMVLTNMTTWAVEHNWNVHDIIPSPITGSAGNQEFLLHLTNGQVM